MKDKHGKSEATPIHLLAVDWRSEYFNSDVGVDDFAVNVVLGFWQALCADDADGQHLGNNPRLGTAGRTSARRINIDRMD